MVIAATDLIVDLPRAKHRFDATTTWVDRQSRRVHFIKSKSTNTAVDVAYSFFKKILSTIAYWSTSYQIVAPSSDPRSREDYLNEVESS